MWPASVMAKEAVQLINGRLQADMKTILGSVDYEKKAAPNKDDTGENNKP